MLAVCSCAVMILCIWLVWMSDVV